MQTAIPLFVIPDKQCVALRDPEPSFSGQGEGPKPRFHGTRAYVNIGWPEIATGMQRGRQSWVPARARLRSLGWNDVLRNAYAIALPLWGGPGWGLDGFSDSNEFQRASSVRPPPLTPPHKGEGDDRSAFAPNHSALTFWFDVHSPWVYLASPRIGPIARKHGLDLVWRPIHLPRLLDEIGGVKPLEANPARVAWFRQDIRDFAELQGMPLSPHPQYPLRNSRALRACQYAQEQGRAEAFVIRLTRAYWAEHGDITDLDLLAAWGEDCGLDSEAVKAAALSETYKQKIDDNTQAAIARGVFGVPTVDTGSKLYFGNDRLDLLDTHLTRQALSR